MKVFLSWSGTKSHKIALAFKDWLPSVIQFIKEDDIFVSSEDIDKGSRWSSEIADKLQNSNFGIICVTAENTKAPWLLFEAGALSKFKNTSRVCSFLFDLKEIEKTNPLSQFQSTKFEKEDILKLIKSLDKANEKKIDERQLTSTYISCYNKLKKSLDKIENGNKLAKNVKPRFFCEYHLELENAKLAIEQELAEIIAKGIKKVYKNQNDAVKDYKKTHYSSNISTINILCIRGENFVSEQDEHWGSIIPINSIKTTILGNSTYDDMILNRYEAHKLPNENEERFKLRYKSLMINTQKILKDYPNNALYLHDEIDLPFRMLFIDDYLFLSTFPYNIRASEAEVIKIHNSSTLFSVCKEYYNKIKLNAKPQ